ncbi:MAG: transcriptional repressor, partial [Actinobacteria bacterium]
MKAEGTLIDAAGLRPTRQRMAILRAVATERRPVTAQDLYARLRGARGSPGLATIYRTL